MKEEMRTEAIEVIVSSVEKFAGKYDLAVRLAPCPVNSRYFPSRLVVSRLSSIRRIQVHIPKEWQLL